MDFGKCTLVPYTIALVSSGSPVVGIRSSKKPTTVSLGLGFSRDDRSLSHRSRVIFQEHGFQDHPLRSLGDQVDNTELR